MALGAREELFHERLLTAEFDVDVAVSDAWLTIVVAALLEAGDGELGLVNAVKLNEDIHGLASRALRDDVHSEISSTLVSGSNASAAHLSSDDFILDGAVGDIADLDDTVGAKAKVMERIDGDKA